MNKNVRTWICVICALLVTIGANAQNAAVSNQLKVKYSLVEYHKDNGGWYLIGKQNGTENEYGFCNKLGKVIAFGGKDYKIYDAFIELYMLDPALKKEHDEWKAKYDEWYKEYVVYEKEKSAYDKKVEIIATEISNKKKEALIKKYGSESWAMTDSEYWRCNSFYLRDEAKVQLFKQGIEPPATIREKPTGPSSGYKWVQYTYIQPQPYQEISFEALKSDPYIDVKKNGLYGVADKNLKLIVPCLYKQKVLGRSKLNGDCRLICSDNKYGAINRSGKIILEMEYKSIESTSNGHLKVSKDGKLYGMYDVNGKEILPCLFADISFAIKSEQSFSAFAQSYVESFVNEWQKRGEFEKTADWQQRVSEETRRQKILELTRQAQSAYIDLYTKNLKDELTLGKYDPDHETFLVESKVGGRMLVAVPIAKAANFKEKFNECAKTPSYFIQNDRIGVAQYEFKLSDTEKYKFSNQASLNYSIAQVEYNFDPISINTSGQDAGQGKQTISTVSLSVGKSDIDLNIPAASEKNDKTFAIIFSNENYQNEKKVDFANNDGYIFSEYCKKTLGLPTENVHYRSDATYNNIRHELNWIKQVAEAYQNQASIIVYYAGHGVPDESSHEAYLLPVDGVSSDVSTGISINELYKTLGQLPARNVYLFMDACFSGALRGSGMLASARGVAIKSKSDVPQGNMVVFSAATGQETAYPYQDKKHGMFTYFLLKKLKETNGDATLGELSDYVITNVKQQSIVVNRKSQTPTVVPSVNVESGWESMRLR